MNIGSIYRLDTDFPIWKTDAELAQNECLRWLIRGEPFLLVAMYEDRDRRMYFQILATDTVGWLFIRAHDKKQFDSYVKEIMRVSK